jgi:hypothetical protein
MQLKGKIIRLLCIAIVISSGCSLFSQERSDYVIVTIITEKINSKHKFTEDYWLLSVGKWKESSPGSLVPLYLYGFSDQDILECSDDELVFFNIKEGESYLGFTSIEKSVENVNRERKKISATVNRKSSGKTKIKVYFTMVSGTFLYCNSTGLSFGDTGHSNNEVAIPVNFSVADFKSDFLKQVEAFPFFLLPYIGLHSIQ